MGNLALRKLIVCSRHLFEFAGLLSRTHNVGLHPPSVDVYSSPRAVWPAGAGSARFLLPVHAARQRPAYCCADRTESCQASGLRGDGGVWLNPRRLSAGSARAKRRGGGRSKDDEQAAIRLSSEES